MLDPIEEIKARLDIVEVVKGYFPLQLAGSNYRARCPFHQEKSGSFMVSTAKQIWHCFGCNQGGDVLSFVMKQEGLEFGEALRMLAERAGVVLERSDPRVHSERTRLMDVLELAAQYYHQALIRAEKGTGARAYCAGRSLEQSLIDEFCIGYSLPEYEALSKFLISRKYTANEILAAGLAVKKEQGYGLTDRFRGRLMIPIRSLNGNVVGFGGRILEGDEKNAKYINSPQTTLYDKSRIVFGLDRAKQEIRIKDFAILVEGYMDFFAIWGAGMHNVVATSGTALTTEQIKLIKRFTSSLYFSFDMDAAGSQATMRGIELALADGMNVRVIRLPRDEKGAPLYKDPDECIHADPALWESCVASAQSFVEFCFDKIITPEAHTDAFTKKKAVRALLDIIVRIPDSIEQDHWIAELARRLAVSERILWEALAQVRTKQPVAPVSPQEKASEAYRSSGETLALALLVKFPALFAPIQGDLSPVHFQEADNYELYRLLDEVYTTTGSLENTATPLRDRLELLADREFEGITVDAAEKILRELIIKIKNSYIHRKTEILQAQVAQAEKDGNTEALKAYLEEFNHLQSL